MANEAENAIYNRLASAPTFHPSSMNLFAQDWALEPGDVVQVESGEETYGMPVYGINFEWKGMNGGESKAVIQSSGNQKREPLPALRRRNYGTRSAIKQQETKFTADIQQVQNDLGAQIGLVVTQKDGVNVIKAASIALAINEAGSAAAIDADQIYLNGNTTVGGSLSVVNGLLHANNGFSTDDLYAGSNGGQFVVEGNDIRAYSRIYAEGGIWALDGAEIQASIGTFGTLSITSGQTTASLGDAIKTIAEDANPPSGKIGFVYTTFADPSTEHKVNFNIAATQTYIDGVAAAELQGWDAAAALTAPPASGSGQTGQTFIFSAPRHYEKNPGVWVREQVDYNFAISKGSTPGPSGYASVSMNGALVGRISIGDWYTSGWADSYAAFELVPNTPQTLNPGGSVTIKMRGKSSSSAALADVDDVTISARSLNLQSKSVTSNGTVTPDNGYDGLSSVDVNVSGGGGYTSNDIRIGSYTNTSSDPGSSYIDSPNMKATILAAINNRNWFGFKAYLNGRSDGRYYKMNFGS